MLTEATDFNSRFWHYVAHGMVVVVAGPFIVLSMPLLLVFFWIGRIAHRRGWLAK